MSAKTRSGSKKRFYKIKSLTDKRIIDKLVEASKAGVKIDMVVRGICCLRNGVLGETEHIHIRSIVGCYLEHSRIYIFGTEDRDQIYTKRHHSIHRKRFSKKHTGERLKNQKKDRLK